MAFGLGLDLSLGSMSNSGGTPAATIRIAPVDSDESYVIAPHPDYGAIALKFQRNVGGSSAADAGSPWEAWRLTGLFALEAVTDDPATEGVEIGDAVGAWDYAFSHFDGQVYYVGSFHGGETVTSYTGTDLTESGYVSSFSFTQVSHLTADSGRELDVTQVFALSASGIVTQSLTATGTDSFGTRTMGMLILDPNFTAYSIDGGETYDTIPNDDTVYDLGAASDLIMRNPVNGLTVRQVTDAMDDPQWTRISGRRRGSDTKTYIEFDTDGVIGTIAMNRTLTFGETEPDVIEYPDTWVGATDGIGIWNRLSGTSAITMVDGELEFDASNTGAVLNRASYRLEGLEADTIYRVHIDARLVGSTITTTFDAQTEDSTSGATSFQQRSAAVVIGLGYFQFTTPTDLSGPVFIKIQQGSTDSGTSDRFYISELGPPTEYVAPSWSPYTLDFTEATPGNANLPLGVTREGGGTAPVTLDTGAGEMTIGGGSGTNRWVITSPSLVLPPGDYVVQFNGRCSTTNNTGQSQVSGVSTGSVSTDQISAAQSFNGISGFTNTHTFTVASGKTGYIAWQATTNTDGRTVTLTSIVVTGTPA